MARRHFYNIVHRDISTIHVRLNEKITLEEYDKENFVLIKKRPNWVKEELREKISLINLGFVDLTNQLYTVTKNLYYGGKRRIYDIPVTLENGETYPLEKYKGSVLLIVNTATKCGLAGQFEELEQLYKTYKEQGLVVLGFPSDQFKQEISTASEAAQACRTV